MEKFNQLKRDLRLLRIPFSLRFWKHFFAAGSLKHILAVAARLCFKPYIDSYTMANKSRSAAISWLGKLCGGAVR